jgi:hypothetical protein
MGDRCLGGLYNSGNGFVPSPGTPGEGEGPPEIDGIFRLLLDVVGPHPCPLPAYRERGSDDRGIGVCYLVDVNLRQGVGNLGDNAAILQQARHRPDV